MNPIKIFKLLLSRIFKVLKYIFKPKETLVILLLGYILFNNLNKKGWYKSFVSGIPLDEKGNPIPWFTYDSIKYIEDNISKNLSVFEYGSGSSTLFFSKRVSKIISMEHDLNWFNTFKKRITTNNINYIHKEEESGYVEEILNHKEKFDIIIIDGKKRVECSKLSIKKLSSKGVVIWDNSDRSKYNEGYDFLIQNGFKRKDFVGYGPINTYIWNTSIFYKENNCLSL